MHSFILLEQLVSFLHLLAKILNKWQEWKKTLNWMYFYVSVRLSNWELCIFQLFSL